MLELIGEVAGAAIEPDIHGIGNPAGEIDRQFVDSSKLRELTGWRPQVELRDGLRRTLEWYREHPRSRRSAPASPAPADARLAMCGRFTVTTKDTKKVADRFQVELEKALERTRRARRRRRRGARERAAAGLGRFNVAPTQEVLTVRSSPDPEEAARGEREARLMRWGLVPRWAKDLKVGYRMINAKTENLTDEPRLRAAGRQVPPPLPDRRRRLLRVDEGGGPEAAAPALALHGRRRRALRLRRDLHPQGVGGGGSGVEDGWLYSCTIVTTTPNEVVAKVHDRMPAILPGPEAEAAWLRPDLELRGRGRDVRAAAGRRGCRAPPPTRS